MQRRSPLQDVSNIASSSAVSQSLKGAGTLEGKGNSRIQALETSLEPSSMQRRLATFVSEKAKAKGTPSTTPSFQLMSDYLEDVIEDWEDIEAEQPMKEIVEDEIIDDGPTSDLRTFIGPDGVATSVPITRIAHAYRSVFPFSHFNAMQSKVFNELYCTDENVVVTAPTGSGKTVLFELAIIRMLSADPSGKAVYLAPLKALCSERVRDWTMRLSPIGCRVVELTGDSIMPKEIEIMEAKLIVATPEKWDVVTRRALKTDPLLSHLALFMVDEVHSVREKVRGARLEVIIARTKARQASVRVVAVSATIPNAPDIARWIGRNPSHDGAEKDGALVPFVFSEAYRPCRLQKFVYGFRYHSIAEQYHRFEKYLDTQVADIMMKHANDKPTLIFCSSRKGTISLAQSLATEIEHGKRNQMVLNIPIPRDPETSRGKGARFQLDCRNQLLKDVSLQGVAFHHAGLEAGDKRAVEDAFLSGKITILCATTSLSIGVNLPAYLVIIKGTKAFGPTMEWEDISDLTVLQMMGRAGRPQYDTSGCCVIMTEEGDALEWEHLVTGRTTIESTLHHDLTEHVNTEIVVQRETTTEMLEEWLKGTYLFVRLQKNPQYYDLPHCQGLSGQDGATALTVRSILQVLSEHQLVGGYDHNKRDGAVFASAFGTIMANYCLRFDTMISLLKDDESGKSWTVADLVSVISHADEFQGLFVRQGEQALYELALRHIRFAPNKVETAAEKVSVLLQAELAGLNLAEVSYELDRGRAPLSIKSETSQIFQMGPKIIRAALSIAVEKKDGESAVAAFQLSRAIATKAWDASNAALCRIRGVNVTIARQLQKANIETVYALAECKIPDLQRLLNLKETLVYEILKEAKKVPRLELSVVQRESRAADAPRGFVDCIVMVDLKLDHSLIDLRSIHTTTGEDRRPLFVGVLVYTLNKEERCCLYNRTTVEQLKAGTTSLELPCRVKASGDTVYVVAAIEEVASSECRLAYGIQDARRTHPVRIARPIERQISPFQGGEKFFQLPSVSEQSSSSVVYPPIQAGLSAANAAQATKQVPVKAAAKSAAGKKKWPKNTKRGEVTSTPSCAHTCPPGCSHPCCPSRFIEIAPPSKKRKQVDTAQRTKAQQVLQGRIDKAVKEYEEEERVKTTSIARPASESSEDIPLAVQARERREKEEAEKGLAVSLYPQQASAVPDAIVDDPAPPTVQQSLPEFEISRQPTSTLLDDLRYADGMTGTQIVDDTQLLYASDHYEPSFGYDAVTPPSLTQEMQRDFDLYGVDFGQDLDFAMMFDQT